MNGNDVVALLIAACVIGFVVGVILCNAFINVEYFDDYNVNVMVNSAEPDSLRGYSDGWYVGTLTWTPVASKLTESFPV